MGGCLKIEGESQKWEKVKGKKDYIKDTLDITSMVLLET